VESPLRVWLVLDGDTLYVDRNGSGDLTEKGKALVSKPQGVGSSFEVGAITDREGKTKHTNLHVGVMPEDKGQKRPGYWYLRVDINDRYRQYGVVSRSAGTPRDAPVVHFGGPLRMGMSRPEEQTLRRGDEPGEISAFITTQYPGVEWVAVDHGKGVPAGVHPGAAIAFPGRTPDARPITLKVPLTQRC